MCELEEQRWAASSEARKAMRILVACEFSGIVRDAFRQRGHDAWSCDYLSSETPGPHIRGDVLEHFGDGWDMLLAFPPCTYLTLAPIAEAMAAQWG
jgi:hypothetical protein